MQHFRPDTGDPADGGLDLHLVARVLGGGGRPRLAPANHQQQGDQADGDEHRDQDRAAA
jgi:hypothetical protein